MFRRDQGVICVTCTVPSSAKAISSTRWKQTTRVVDLSLSSSFSFAFLSPCLILSKPSTRRNVCRWDRPKRSARFGLCLGTEATAQSMRVGLNCPTQIGHWHGCSMHGMPFHLQQWQPGPFPFTLYAVKRVGPLATASQRLFSLLLNRRTRRHGRHCCKWNARNSRDCLVLLPFCDTQLAVHNVHQLIFVECLLPRTEVR